MLGMLHKTNPMNIVCPFIKRRRRTVARRAAEVFGVGSLIFYFSLMGPTFFEKPLYCVSVRPSVRPSVCVRRLTIVRKVLNRLTSGLLHLKDHS